MPDVHFWYKDNLIVDGRFACERLPGAVQNHIKMSVARHMDCYDDDGKEIEHDWRTQITIVTFEPTSGLVNKLGVMYVLAYDWPDRMANIGNRLKAIGLSVRVLLGIPESTLDLQFIPIPRPTTTQQGCWVNV